MKKITFLLLIVISIPCFSQKSTLTKEEYLAKSKSQKTTAWVMLGIGGTLLAVAAPGNVSFDILPAMVISGGGLVVGSIPLFLAAGKNKRKAMSLSFKNEKIPFLSRSGFTKLSCPSISLKIGF